MPYSRAAHPGTQNVPNYSKPTVFPSHHGEVMRALCKSCGSLWPPATALRERRKIILLPELFTTGTHSAFAHCKERHRACKAGVRKRCFPGRQIIAKLPYSGLFQPPFRLSSQVNFTPCFCSLSGTPLGRAQCLRTRRWLDPQGP